MNYSGHIKQSKSKPSLIDTHCSIGGFIILLKKVDLDSHQFSRPILVILEIGVRDIEGQHVVVK